MSRTRLLAAATLLAVLSLGVVSVPAAADVPLVYKMTGRDTYQVGTLRRSIEFGGEETTRVVKRGSDITLVSNKGEDDSDTLSVVNQALPPVLQNEELRALNALQGRVALDLPSSLTETSLAGYLEPVTPRVSGDLIGLRFAATAETSGALPKDPSLVVEGVVTLSGTAYYGRSSGVLDRIESRLSFEGHLRGGDSTVPVHLLYERYIHVVVPVIALRRGAR